MASIFLMLAFSMV